MVRNSQRSNSTPLGLCPSFRRIWQMPFYKESPMRPLIVLQQTLLLRLPHHRTRIQNHLDRTKCMLESVHVTRALFILFGSFVHFLLNSFVLIGMV